MARAAATQLALSLTAGHGTSLRRTTRQQYEDSIRDLLSIECARSRCGRANIGCKGGTSARPFTPVPSALQSLARRPEAGWLAASH